MLLLSLLTTALLLLTTATRTMDKIDVARGEDSKVKVGVKTINLNIIAAFIQIVSFLFWVLSDLYMDNLIYMAAEKQIAGPSFVAERMIVAAVSSILMFVSLYILIHVFWHYGINIEETMKKRQQKEQARQKEKEDELLMHAMCSEFPVIDKKVEELLTKRESEISSSEVKNAD